MPIFNLLVYSENYAKPWVSLWQYHREEPNDNITHSKSFKLKSNTYNTDNAGIANIKIVVTIKYLSNSWTDLSKFH